MWTSGLMPPLMNGCPLRCLFFFFCFFFLSGLSRVSIYIYVFFLGGGVCLVFLQVFRVFF